MSEQDTLKQIMEIALKMGQSSVNPETVRENRSLLNQLEMRIKRIEHDLYPDSDGKMRYEILREYVQEIRKKHSQNRNYFIGAVLSLIGSMLMFIIQFLSKYVVFQ